MSRELFKSMVYKDNKVYTRQCSNNVNPKNYDREELCNLILCDYYFLENEIKYKVGDLK